MRFINKFMLLVLLAALSSCASVGNESLKQETELSINQKIVEGKTTKSEIETLFSSPTFSSFDTGLEVWKYDISEINPKTERQKNTSVDIKGTPIKNAPNFSSTRHIKELIVIFDEKGIVKKYFYSTFPGF